MNEFFDECARFANLILEKRPQIQALLADYQTHETTEHEISSAMDTLKGVRQEFSSISNPREGLVISVFSPLNLPLYSLVLHGIIPSAFGKQVYLRPPEVLQPTLKSLAELLGVGTRFFESIALKNIPRHVFVDLYACESDVVVFTGKYENALDIHQSCSQALLIYEGSGVCPFIVMPNGDIDVAIEKAVAMRCFNSGQDCVAPDAILVPEASLLEFSDKLLGKLGTVKVGNSHDPEVRVTSLVKDSYIKQIEEVFEQERAHIIYGGKIDVKNKFVYPTVIQKRITDHAGAFHEFFAPVFYVLSYQNDAEVIQLLSSPSFVEHSMYASVFGSNDKIELHLKLSTILRGTTVNDIEQGNQPYGGYGSRANFLLYGEQKVVKPILISHDLHLSF